MSINVEDAFEIPDTGIVSSDSDGNRGLYITSGTGAPSGDAPVNSWYFRVDTNTLYYKYGALITDWRQVRAADVTAMDTSQQPAVQTHVQEILSLLLAGDTPAVSQTIVFGGGGNTAQNSWLANQGVVSSSVGVPVGLANASIRSVFLGNENIRSGSVFIRERSPAGTGTYVNVYELVLSNQSFATVTGLNVPVTQGAELGVFTTVSLKNVKVVININGDSA